MTDPADLEFTIEVKSKPVAGGVQVSEIPKKLVDYLEEHYAEVMKEGSDTEIVLTSDTKANAQRLALYAAAWGKSREEKLYVKKLPNGKQYPDNVARLSIAKDEDVPEENRPGRNKKK